MGDKKQSFVSLENYHFPRSLAFFIALGPIYCLTIYTLKNTILAQHYLVHEPLHILIECVGSFIALFVGYNLLVIKKHDKGSSFTHISAAALFGMGVLDGFHAMAPPGQYFVWTHTLAGVVGGLLFCMMCLPKRLTRFTSDHFAYVSFLMSVLCGVFFWEFPDAIPTMVESSGGFSFLARNLNIIGGVLMFFAAGRLIMNYLNKRHEEDLLFAIHCYFFGLSGVMFEYSELWDVAWWGWHGIRFVAYLVGLTFSIKVMISMMRSNLVQDVKMKEINRFQTIFESYPGLTFLLDAQGTVLRVNSEIRELTGYEATEVIMEPFSKFVPAASGAITKFTNHHRDNFAGHKTFGITQELLLVQKNGSMIPVEMNLSSMRMEDGEVLLVVVIEDVTIRHKLEETRIASRILELENQRLKKLALKDPLTGLINRRGFTECFFEALNDHKRTGANYQVVLIDLDDFKDINDVYGYFAGDIVLKEIVKCIGQNIRDTDMFARLGGDEFMILLKYTNKAEGFVVVEKVLNAVRCARVGISQSREIRVTASIALESLSDDIHSLDELLQKLHYYLNVSKRSGKDQAISDEGSTASHDDQKFSLSQVLLDEKNYRVVSQPIVELAQRKAIGCELLSRIAHKEFSMPDEFLSFARSNHILNTVDLICLKQCVNQSKKIHQDMRVHVNLFPSSLVNLPATEILNLFGKNTAERFCLEISEQQLIGDPYHLREKLKALKAGGINIALDDFGFGYSSLESLVILEPDVVKIDKAFVRDVHLRKEKKAHLERMINIIRSNGSEPVVEGIENELEHSVAYDLGVRYAQGYLFGRPAPIESGSYQS